MIKRLPNFKIGSAIADLADFSNYNNTITAQNCPDNKYIMFHWSTLILTYNTATQKIEYLQSGFISQTTSTLVGRIVRSLPRQSVMDYLATPDLPKRERMRIARMLGLMYQH